MGIKVFPVKQWIGQWYSVIRQITLQVYTLAVVNSFFCRQKKCHRQWMALKHCGFSGLKLEINKRAAAFLAPYH